MLQSEYTTSCFMAKTVIWHNFQSSSIRRCRPRKLKSVKNNHHVFETEPRKFGDAKISHYTVFLTIEIQINNTTSENMDFYFSLFIAPAFMPRGI